MWIQIQKLVISPRFTDFLTQKNNFFLFYLFSCFNLNHAEMNFFYYSSDVGFESKFLFFLQFLPRVSTGIPGYGLRMEMIRKFFPFP